MSDALSFAAGFFAFPTLCWAVMWAVQWTCDARAWLKSRAAVSPESQQ